MRIVFFGTPEYVVPIVDSLYKNFKVRSGESAISAVITQKPKPTGRKQILDYSPVDSWAHKKRVPKYYDPMDLITNNIVADLGILASYGEMIPESVLTSFKYGILNIHPSLLPKFKGASPVQATLVSGNEETGVTIIKLDKLLDHGPIISQFTERVLPEDTTETLRRRLFLRSAEVLSALIPAYLQGKIKPKEQDHSKSIFTRQIKKEDAFIPPKFLEACLQGLSLKARWKIPFLNPSYFLQPTPYNLHNFVRAMHPWPVAWSTVKIKDQEFRLKILKSHLQPIMDKSSAISHKLVLDEVQLEGKNPVSWKQFLQGYPGVEFK